MWLKQRGPIKRLFSVSLSIQINQEEKLWDHGSPSTIRGEWVPGYGQVAWNKPEKSHRAREPGVKNYIYLTHSPRSLIFGPQKKLADNENFRMWKGFWIKRWWKESWSVNIRDLDTLIAARCSIFTTKKSVQKHPLCNKCMDSTPHSMVLIIQFIWPSYWKDNLKEMKNRLTILLLE